MRTQGNRVYFTAERKWFDAERSGEKPNTVRLMDDREWAEIQAADLTGVVIAFDERTFTRRLTGIFDLGPLLGKHLVIFCWEPE